MFQSELALTRISRISLAKHGVTVSRHNLSGLKETPNVLLQLIVIGIEPDVFGHLKHHT